MSQVPRNQAGMALVVVLCLSAVLGIASMGLLRIYENMQRDAHLIRFHGEAANLTRYITNVLAQPQLCDAALRGRGGQLIRWPTPPVVDSGYTGTAPSSVPTATVYQVLGPGAVAGAQPRPLAKIGFGYSPAAQSAFMPDSTSPPPMFQITDMYLRRAYEDLDGRSRLDGYATFGTGAAAVRLQTISAELVVQFQFCDSGRDCSVDYTTLPHAPRSVVMNSTQRTVDVNLAIDQTGVIRHCYQPKQQQIAPLDCGSKSYGRLGSACRTIPTGCYPLYTVEGFDGFGVPKCACHIACTQYFQGPAGGASLHTSANSPDPVQATYDQVMTNLVATTGTTGFSLSGLGLSPVTSYEGSTGSAITYGANREKPAAPR